MEGSARRHGPVAQLGARLNGIQEVTGSIPVRSTTLRSRLILRERLRVAGHPYLPDTQYRLILDQVLAKGVHRSRRSREGGLPPLETATSRDSETPRIVYIIQSTSDPAQFYTGPTSNFRGRLDAHDDGRSAATARYRLWRPDLQRGRKCRRQATVDLAALSYPGLAQLPCGVPPVRERVLRELIIACVVRSLPRPA
jgi:hypothetical protein